MKKTLLSIAFAAFALCGFAQTTTTYTDDLTVTINGESTEPQQTEILVTENVDGTFNLSLDNFILYTEDDLMPVGNITLNNLIATTENGITKFETTQEITIQPGNLEGSTPDMWMGPLLGNVPVDLQAKLNADKLYCTIDIDMMEGLGQIIEVVFGTDEFNTTPEQGATSTYTDNLTVTINGESTEPQQTEILVTENVDGTFNLSLDNFILYTEDDLMPVGNITLNNLIATTENGITKFETTQEITIQPGNLEGSTPDMWMGPLLGNVPVDLQAKLNADKLYCTIDIDMMSSLGQIIEVVFGTDEFNTTPEGGDGIENVTAADAKVNVYNLQGVVVKTNVNTANALDGLKQGIYIVNGKKVVK